jgi:ankyrin repeat protein
MAKTRSRFRIWLKLTPLLLFICLFAWCTSNRHRMQQIEPVKVELTALFMEQGLLANSLNPVLSDVAKKVGESEMNSLLYDAAPKASLPALQWIVQNGAVPKNVLPRGNQTFLQQVALKPELMRMQYFLDFGLNPLERSRDGRTVLHAAAQGELTEPVLTLLLSKGLKVTDVDSGGMQPMHYASAKSVAVLQKAGAEIDAKDSLGRTPMDIAAKEGESDVVTEMLNHSASVFSKDNKGRTPLHYAAIGSKSDGVIEALLAHGAPITARDDDGEVPRDLAKEPDSDPRSPYHQSANKL